MFFDYCGSRVHFEDLNEHCGKKSETIVFLHGWGSDMRVFLGVSKYFQKKYRCLLVDFLGFGKSDIPTVCTTVAMQGDMINALCNYLEIKNFHIISHSYGGRVSIYLMAKENSRVLSALLVAPAGVRDESFLKKAKQRCFKIRKKLTRKRNIYKLEKYYSQDYLNSSGVMRETFKSTIACDQTSELSKIYQRVLIVRGKNDTAISRRVVKKMSGRMKNCQICEIRGDHFAFLQSMAEFRLISKDFFCVSD